MEKLNQKSKSKPSNINHRNNIYNNNIQVNNSNKIVDRNENISKPVKNRNIIKPSKNGKYNMDFIDWNNEWERVSEIETKIENCEEISDKEEEERVRSHMIHSQMLYYPGVSITNFPLVAKPDKTRECYICLKNFSQTSKVRRLPCNHMFCEPCLIPWFISNSVCPTCKYKLKEEGSESEENF